MPDKINQIINKIKTGKETDIATGLVEIERCTDLSDKEKLALAASLAPLFYRDHAGMTGMIILANRAEKQIARFGHVVLPFLIDELISADAESTVHLGRAIALNGPGAVAPLLAAWDKERSDNTAAINLMQALAYFRAPEVMQAIPQILLAARAANFQVRAMALDALGRLVQRLAPELFANELRLEIFDTAFGQLSDNHPLVRMQAARALGKMLKKDILSEPHKDKLRRVYRAILGQDEEHEWDDAYIVRHEAARYLPLLARRQASAARYTQSFRIVHKRELCPNTFHYVIEAPLIARKLEAGQFIMIRPHQYSERIPLSICGWDRREGHIEIIVMSAGKTTSEINAMAADECFADIVGPLGERSHVQPHSGTCVVIGGGYGTGAVIPTARDLKALGNRVIGIVGARSKDLLIMVDELAETCDEVLTTTNDGSAGIQGFVTAALEQVIGREPRVSHVLAIGPVPMMQAVCELTRPLGIETFVSLNAIMVDGTGMCGACRVSIGGETRFACFHGPDFNGHQVDFDQLTKRQKMFVAEEQKALTSQ